MPKYKEVDGVRYQVLNNTFLGSNLIPVDAGGSLPEVDASDNGKVLTVVAGEWDAAAVPKELPSVAGNAGKVLTVNSGATGTEWKDAPSGLPAVTIDDAGDVLTVNASGEWEAAAPSGGGSPLLVNITTQDNIVFTMDKTYAEIKAAASSPGVLCILDFPGENTEIFSVIGFYDEEGVAHSVYLPDIASFTGGVSPYVLFTASSTSGYPTFVQVEPGPT